MSEYLIDYRSIVRLVIKLTGIALVIFSLVQMASIAPMTILGGFSGELGDDWLLWTSAPLIGAFFGIVLWLFPAPIANSLFRFETEGSGGYPSWLDRLEVIGIGLLGLWLAFRSLSDLVYHLVMLRQRGMPDQLAVGYTEFPAYFVATLIEMGLALFLIFGATGIARIVRRYRYGGLNIEDKS